MGNKDDYQYDYLDDNERFADQINGALFEDIRAYDGRRRQKGEAIQYVQGV